MKPLEMEKLLTYPQMSQLFSNIDMISELHDMMGKKLRETNSEHPENIYNAEAMIKVFADAVLYF